MADRCFVADMNHDNPVDFKRLAAAGVVGVIHKATQGVGFADPMYRTRRKDATDNGLMWGAYNFNTHGDVAASVAHFFDVAQPDARTSMWLDFERNPRSDMTIDEARKFLDLVDQRLGRYCGIYGGDKLREALTKPDAFFAKHPLWFCQYPSAKSIDDAIARKLFRIPRPWQDTGAFLIQYAADGNGPPPHTFAGIEKNADLSFYAGDRAAITAAWPLPRAA